MSGRGDGKTEHGKGTGYSLDRRLKPRVKQVMNAFLAVGAKANVDDVLQQLQEEYPEYARKRRNALKHSVMTALSEIYKRKQASGLPQADLDGRSDSDFSEDAHYLEAQDRNTSNNSMSDLYSRARASMLQKQADGGNRDNAAHSRPSLTQEGFPLAAPGLAISDTSHGSQATPLREGGRYAGRSDRPHRKRKVGEDLVLEGDAPKTTSNTSTKRPKTTYESATVSLKLSDVGGIDGLLPELNRLLLHLRHPRLFEWLGVDPPRGLLLHGAPGCGKTLLGSAIAGELGLPLYKVAATELVSSFSGDSEERLRELFASAKVSSPCLVFIDEIDAIAPKRESASKDMERRIVAQLLTCMDELNEAKANVLVLGATNRPDALDPALRRAGRFDREICLGIPDAKARSRILKVVCRQQRVRSDFDYDKIAKLTPGFVGADLVSLTREAAISAIDRILGGLGSSDELSSELGHTLSLLASGQEDCLSKDLLDVFIETSDYESAVKLVQPSAKREGFVTVPDVTWEDIGALEAVREQLNIAIVAPVRRPECFEALGLTNPAGVLLAGPPGCGKTLLAKAIANEAGINFISVKGPELLNMYVGESEKAVRQVFQRARNSAPCVIFFDEIDSLCPRRTEHSENQVTARVVNQLLTEMDGLETRKQVFLLAATNRPDILDPAVLRPGRLGRIVFVDLPSAGDRAEILRTLTKNGSRPALGPDVDFNTLASSPQLNNFSGADLASLVREAAVLALKEALQSNLPPPAISVMMSHFLMAFDRVKPSVTETDRQWYHKLRIKFSADGRAAS